MDEFAVPDSNPAQRMTLRGLAVFGGGVMAGRFARDPVYAWIGTPDRHLGLLAWCLFAVAFLAGQAVASTLRPLLRAVVVATLGIGVYSMLELVGVAPIELVADSS